jgi:tetratricopeptide (TPR) repeat protein
MNRIRLCLLLFGLLLNTSMLWAQYDVQFQAGLDARDAHQKISYFTKALDARATSDAYFERGWAYIDLRRFNSAIKDFKAALKSEGNKSASDINNALAVCYYFIGQYPKTIEYADKVLAEIPYAPQAYRFRCLAHLEMNQYPQAEKDAGQYIKYLPQYADGYALRYQVYFFQKKYAQALADIDSALKRDITNRRYKLQKVFTLNRLGRNTEAEKLIRETIDLKDNDPYSLQAVGNIYAEMGDHERAVDFYLRALTLHDERSKANVRYRPEHLKAIHSLNLALGQAYQATQDFNKALKYITQAINLIPNDYVAYERLGNLHCVFLKNYNQAVGAYARCFELNPRHPAGWINYGYSLSRIGKEQSAITVYEQALKLDSVESKALMYNNLGFGYLKLKKYPQALLNLNKSIETDPDLPMAHISLGEYYLELKKYPEAVAKFDHALDMENISQHERAVAFYNRGLARYRQKKLAEALTDLDKAVELEPDYTEALEACGIAYYDSGNLCKAHTLFKKAIQSDAGKAVPQALQSKNYLLKITAKTKEPCK